VNPFLTTVVVLLAATTPHPTQIHAADSWTIQVSLVYTNGTNNTNVSSVVADILTINSTNATLTQNFTLSNGASYNETDFGSNLTDVTDVVIFPHNITQFPNASAEPVDVNVTSQGNESVTIVFSPWELNSTAGLPSLFPPPPNLPTVPLFIALAGVGIAGFVGWLGYRGLRQMYSVFSNGEI
jgi:hypothetical protein